MPEYRRSRIGGGTFFFTVVTFARQPIFTSEPARRILHHAWKDVMDRFPYILDAVCLLPDHIHCIWTLPEEDSNYSVRWKEIKRLFTKDFLAEIGTGEHRNKSRQKRNEAAIWQRRFWEHTIRDDLDLERHIEYIHFNPVKHGLVQRVRDWPWSSFKRFVRMGYYSIDWGDNVDDVVKKLPCRE